MITVHIIVDRVIIFIKRFNKCTILISIFRMLSATGLTAFAFQTNTTQHNIPYLFFVILREHLRIIPSWIIKKLTDVFIAVVCIGESFVQYFLQLLLFRFLRVKVFHSILIIQLLITFFNSIHFCLGLFSLHYRGNSKAKGLKYKTDSILSIYTQY